MDSSDPGSPFEYDAGSLHAAIESLARDSHFGGGLRDDTPRSQERVFDHGSIGVGRVGTRTRRPRRELGFAGAPWDRQGLYARPRRPCWDVLRAESEVLRSDRAARGDEHRPLDPILELPNVPRPFVLLESVAGRLSEGGRDDAVSSSQGREKVVRERQNI